MIEDNEYENNRDSSVESSFQNIISLTDSSSRLLFQILTMIRKEEDKTEYEFWNESHMYILLSYLPLSTGGVFDDFDDAICQNVIIGYIFLSYTKGIICIYSTLSQ